MTDINNGLPPNDLRLFLRTISMATPEQVIRLGKESADHIDAQAATIKALVEALERIDDLTGHNMAMSARDEQCVNREARAALAAAKETPHE